MKFTASRSIWVWAARSGAWVAMMNQLPAGFHGADQGLLTDAGGQISTLGGHQRDGAEPKAALIAASAANCCSVALFAAILRLNSTAQSL